MFNFTCLSFYEANMREITCCFHWEPVRSSKEKKEAKKTLYARITYHSLTCLDIPAITARDTYQTWNYRKAIKLTIFANFYLIIFNVREIKKQLWFDALSIENCWVKCCNEVFDTSLQSIAAMISAHSCEHWLPVWHHHILLITVFSLFFATPPLHLTWQQMRHLWQRLTRQWPSPTSSGLLSVSSLGGREKKNRWDLKGQKKEEDEETEVFQIMVWDNRTEWDWKSAKTTVAPAQAVCFLQVHDICHTTVTLTGNCHHLILDCLKKPLNETFLSV